ncbi:hypothetical protein SK128_027546 [Halocaridina rubra]|uniref:Uncharacterized protein n=1 Tax=Halocaridina rubra TaxID=373956 RepID=A0AAN8XJN0_HALRR
MDELLQYDVATTSHLFDDEGLMTKSIKCDIVHELGGNLSDQDPRTPKCYIVNVMANTRCDYTSKVGTKHVALMTNPEIHLNDFMVATGNMDNVVVKAEAYLTQVIKQGTGMKTMDQLQNYKYHHAKRSCLDDLPPTSHAIRSHIKEHTLPHTRWCHCYHHVNPLTQKSLGDSVYQRDPVLADLVYFYLMENLPRPLVPATPGYGFGDNGAQLVVGNELVQHNVLMMSTHMRLMRQ